MRISGGFAMSIAFVLGACTSGGVTPETAEAPPAAVGPAPVMILPPTTASSEPEPTPGLINFLYEGELTQGGWIRGQAPAGTLSATLGDQPLVLDAEGNFFAAFDRDAGPLAKLTAQMGRGRTIESQIAVSPREWNIERVNVARRAGGSSAAFMERRRPELAQIHAARTADADANGWRQDFIWPATGRISGRFGSQRIYRGVPGSYHSGIDIAQGGSGGAVVAPADGVVTLATPRPFSLEGYLLFIDHGQGLNSAFLHLSKIAVEEGDRVRQGQYIANIGSSGRATGPHLHWSLKWRDARLDPLLFTGPMP